MTDSNDDTEAKDRRIKELEAALATANARVTRLGQTSLPVTSSGKTRSTADAMSLLHSTKKVLIDRARDEAETLCLEHGKTHSRAVRARMAELGLLDDGENEFWLGAVFRDRRFAPTGETFTYSDPTRNVHERTVRVWRLSYIGE